MRLSLLFLAISASLGSYALANENQSAARAETSTQEVNMADKNTSVVQENPFFQVSTLPFQAPRFDLIQESDFEPAIAEGIRQKLAEVEQIANNPEPPTFENTYIALEKAGALLDRVMSVFGALTGANTSDTLQRISEEQSPKLAALGDAITLNSKLFERLQTLYDQRDTLDLTPEDKRLIEVTHQHFVLAGARLSDADKAQLKSLNQEAATLGTQFVNRLLAAAKNGAVQINSKEQLAGLSEPELKAAEQAARDRNLDQQWLLTLQNTTQQPWLASLSNRDTRKALFDASWSRAEKGDANDTRQLITRLAKVRAEQARLLGFPDYATWKLQDQMAKKPEAALGFMRDIVPAATARAKREAADIQAVIDKQGGGFKLQAWDWPYYAEQVRKARYDLDESQIRPYFELNNVLHNGVFYAAQALYGITFKERTDIPVYQSDVKVYEVFDKDGSSMALFYTDFFARDNKSGGAWMGNFVDQSRLMGTKPVVYNVCNFTRPASGQPALLSWDDVITLFHEFGHALHGMFADQMYGSISGANTPSDFVEFPSQINEHWAEDPEVFANYAKHYATGKPMPAELVEKIKTASRFNKGYDMTELLAAALLDMHWHMIKADEPEQDVDAFEKAALEEDRVNLSYVPPRYRSSYFMHIWGNGYAAGYYAYIWTQMLADDGFKWFREHGGLTPENGQRFRDMVLSRGNSTDLEKVYRDWRGHEPDIEPMLINRGLKGDSEG
ncbi:dipeptidyl carboxypeptidase II [Pseudomonas asuensis]|uniref:Dipeptidyl carboxypeptidase II n=1 Tax=Pseudomonas asuensis TaxID=1825787 RepID=A0ABQ2H258_9PSED|nr:peptidyl-dipeptidase Dcp [Pseudomonas asuensis]GGM23165.1 dipeptidyl carboxypeptidase II [Pseudomonas asuensis]